MPSKKRREEIAPNEFYPTPEWCIHRLLDRCLESHELDKGTFLEPAYGEGAIPQAFASYKERIDGVEWFGIDIEPDTRTMKESAGNVVCDDYTTYLIARHTDKFRLFPKRFDLVITNPPFSLATEYLINSLQVATGVFMLLPITWLASAKRHHLITKSTPDVFLLPDRVSFTNDGQSNSVEYAWFYWDSVKPKSKGSIEVLDLTPLEERKVYL